MLDRDNISILREALESKEKFLPLLEYFVQKSILEIKENEKYPKENYNYSSFYSSFIENYSKINTDLIFENCQSPIERIFVSSLLLLFVKNQDLGFTITPILPDAEVGIKNYRNNHLSILKLIESYKLKTGDLNLDNFELAFEEKYILSGKYSKDDFKEICYHYYIVKNFTFYNYHLTLQPKLLNLKIDDKSIRPDILLWKPGNKKLKLIVECDGFEYHNSKRSFENDRKRDRLLKLNGYEVIRYSGSEIFKNPAIVSEDLYNFLKSIDK